VTADDAAPPVTKVLIDMESVNYIDLEGCDMLNEIAENMKGVEVEIHVIATRFHIRTTTRTIGEPLILRHKDEVSYKVSGNRGQGIEFGSWNSECGKRRTLLDVLGVCLRHELRPYVACKRQSSRSHSHQSLTSALE
jgi:MFS superfamily sulfate permease-like transporter